jgi:hypothetical protein
MNPKEYAELLEYIHKNNGWEHTLYGRHEGDKKPLIKYVSCSFDTRTGEVWQVSFNIHASETFSIGSTKADREKFKADIYNWLNGEV